MYLVVKSFENLVQEGLPGEGWRAGHVEDTEMLPRSEVQISSVDARIWVHALCVCVCVHVEGKLGVKQNQKRLP